MKYKISTGNTNLTFIILSIIIKFLYTLQHLRYIIFMNCNIKRKKLDFSGIQDVRFKHKQIWINHLERMDNSRHPKHALNYKPRGRRDRGRPRKRWQCVDAGTGQTT